MIILGVSVLVGCIWVVLAIIAVMLIFLILMQDSKSGGLSTAFGAAGGDTLLGARAQKDLAKITTYLAITFVVLCVLGGKLDKAGVMVSVVGSDDPVKAGAPSDPGDSSTKVSGTGEKPPENAPGGTQNSGGGSEPPKETSPPKEAGPGEKSGGADSGAAPPSEKPPEKGGN